MNQEIKDPIVQFIIVRESLNMTMGKACSQVGHGVMMCMQEYTHFVEKDYVRILAHHKDRLTDEQEKIYSIFIEWLQSDYRKVVLRADDKEFEKLKLLEEQHFVVRDNTLATETVIAFMPMYKSKAPKIIKRLQVLG
jgi:peptidyl-tRNA hydrolase